MWSKASKERDLLTTAKQAKEAEVEQLKNALQTEQEKNMKLEMRLQAWIQEHNQKSEHRDALIGELASNSTELTRVKNYQLILEEELNKLRPVKRDLDAAKADLATAQKGFAEMQEMFKANKAQIEAARQDAGAYQELNAAKTELSLANGTIAKLRSENAALRGEIEAGKVTIHAIIEERKMHARVEARLEDTLKTAESAAGNHKQVQQELNMLKVTHKEIREKHDHMIGNWEVKECEITGHKLTIADLRKDNEELQQARDTLAAEHMSMQSNLQAAKLLHKAEQTSAKDLLAQLTDLQNLYEQATLDRDAARAHCKQAQEEKILALHGMNNLRGALSSVAPLFEPIDMPAATPGRLVSQVTGQGMAYQQLLAMPQKPSQMASQMMKPQLPGQMPDAADDVYIWGR